MTSLENAPRRKRGRPGNAERPIMIADAAIRLLSENGSRSLSHRRVDQEAGLPLGSTTHHAPSRGELLLMAAKRLSELSQQELKPFADYIASRGTDLTPEDVARGMMDLWRSRLAEDQLHRVRAEMTVMLSQEFETEMRALFQPQITRIELFWQETLARLGSEDPVEAGFEFSVWSRGLFCMIAMRGGVADEEEARRVERWIARHLRALISPGYATA